MPLTQDLKEDIQLLTFAGVAAGVGIAAYVTGQPRLAWPAIASVDLYLLVAVVLTALRSDDKGFRGRNKWVDKWFPRHTAGLAVILLLLTASVTAFAGLYVGTDVFSPRKDRLDAVYVSVLILGINDLGPRKGYGQFVVLTQFISGVVLFIFAFPLVLSGLSTHGSPDA